MFQFFTKAAMVGYISDVIGRVLDPATVTISQASASQGFGTNREVEIEASYPSADGQSTITKKFFYFRTDLSNVASMGLPTKVPMHESANVHYLLKYINELSGLNLTIEDVEDLSPVIDDGNLATFTIPLVAKPGSWWFKGSYDLKVGRKPHISTTFSSTELGQI